ncbi:flavodoxin family protein [Inediibacterium massiliense]|uniref:flavodoxin family protein n=1 Tax=Inediibacterium massiliense TaxID=1658111 RepID=UPI0006B40677|nr:NAD(P)H-dependent oxidoreductase [Inediibacterium massiliense]
MKISIIFHSVCGNTYLMAKAFYNSLKQIGKDVYLYRVYDEDLEKLSHQFPVASEYYKEIVNTPIATPETLLESDHVILGSPTYFGNVSAEMKAYMDSMSIYWVEAKLSGKRLTAFASASTPFGGGEACLQAINTFGQHMGMISISVPSNLIPTISMSAYGIIHYSGPMGDQRPNKDTLKVIDEYVKKFF